MFVHYSFRDAAFQPGYHAEILKTLQLCHQDVNVLRHPDCPNTFLNFKHGAI